MEEMSCSRVNSNPRPSLSVLYRYNVKRCNNLNLVFGEVGFGLVIQPLYTSFLIKLLHENNSDCSRRKRLFISLRLFSFSSAFFLGVVVLSVDRFLAIHLRLRYQEFCLTSVLLVWWSQYGCWVYLMFFQGFGFCVMYLNTCYGTFWKCWRPSYNSDLHQTPQESDSGPASSTRDTGWRCRKFCQSY